MDWKSWISNYDIDELTQDELAKLVKEAVQIFGWSQNAFSEYIGVAQSTFSRWMHGRPTGHITRAVRNAFKTPVKPNIRKVGSESRKTTDLLIRPTDWTKQFFTVNIPVNSLSDEDLSTIWKILSEKLNWSIDNFSKRYKLNRKDFEEWLDTKKKYTQAPYVIRKILTLQEPPCLCYNADCMRCTEELITRLDLNTPEHKTWKDVCDEIVSEVREKGEIQNIVFVDGDNVNLIETMTELNPTRIFRIIFVYSPSVITSYRIPKKRTKEHSLIIAPVASKDSVDQMIALMVARLDLSLDDKKDILFYIITNDTFVSVLSFALEGRVVGNIQNALSLWSRTVYPLITKDMDYDDILRISKQLYKGQLSEEMALGTYLVLHDNEYYGNINKEFIMNELKLANLVV